MSNPRGTVLAEDKQPRAAGLLAEGEQPRGGSLLCDSEQPPGAGLLPEGEQPRVQSLLTDSEQPPGAGLLPEGEQPPGAESARRGLAAPSGRAHSPSPGAGPLLVGRELFWGLSFYGVGLLLDCLH